MHLSCFRLKVRYHAEVDDVDAGRALSLSFPLRLSAGDWPILFCDRRGKSGVTEVTCRSGS